MGKHLSSWLSGLGRYDTFYGSVLIPPWERDGDTTDEWLNYMQQHNVKSMHNANFFEGDEQNKHPHGFVIHANCWTLVERIIGPKAEERLDLFLKVLRRRWKEHPFEINMYREDVYGTEPVIEGPYWAQPDFLASGFDYLFGVDYGPSFEHFDELVTDVITRNTICLRDPIKIPRLRDLIRRCIHDSKREEVKRKTRRWHRTSNGNIDHLIAGGLPLDIKFCILDHLDGKDVRNALLAFGWIVPQLYFQARFPKKLIFEVEDLGSDAEINWKKLFFGVDDLLESSPEMENRQRIFRILEGTKELFANMGGFDECNKD